jgi:hypothetical protein
LFSVLIIFYVLVLKETYEQAFFNEHCAKHTNLNQLTGSLLLTCNFLSVSLVLPGQKSKTVMAGNDIYAMIVG